MLIAVLLGLGAIFFILAAVMGFNYYSFVKNAKTASGIVTDIERRQDPNGSRTDYPIISYVTREGEEKTFQSKVGTGIGLYKKNQQVEVYYANEEARLKGGSEAQIYSVFGVAGLVMLVIGGALAMHAYRRQKDIAWLEQHGQRIETQLIDIRRVTYLKVNGRAPYVLVCKGKAPSGETMVFKSDMLGFRPQVDLEEKIIVPVFIDPQHPKRYYVDTTFLSR